MSKEEMINAILELQAGQNKIMKLLEDNGYDTKDGEFNGIEFGFSDPIVKDFLTDLKNNSK